MAIPNYQQDAFSSSPVASRAATGGSRVVDEVSGSGRMAHFYFADLFSRLDAMRNDAFKSEAFEAVRGVASSEFQAVVGSNAGVQLEDRSGKVLHSSIEAMVRAQLPVFMTDSPNDPNRFHNFEAGTLMRTSIAHTLQDGSFERGVKQAQEHLLSLLEDNTDRKIVQSLLSAKDSKDEPDAMRKLELMKAITPLDDMIIQEVISLERSLENATTECKSRRRELLGNEGKKLEYAYAKNAEYLQIVDPLINQLGQIEPSTVEFYFNNFDDVKDKLQEITTKEEFAVINSAINTKDIENVVKTLDNLKSIKMDHNNRLNEFLFVTNTISNAFEKKAPPTLLDDVIFGNFNETNQRAIAAYDSIDGILQSALKKSGINNEFTKVLSDQAFKEKIYAKTNDILTSLDTGNYKLDGKTVGDRLIVDPYIKRLFISTLTATVANELYSATYGGDNNKIYEDSIDKIHRSSFSVAYTEGEGASDKQEELDILRNIASTYNKVGALRILKEVPTDEIRKQLDRIPAHLDNQFYDQLGITKDGVNSILELRDSKFKLEKEYSELVMPSKDVVLGSVRDGMNFDSMNNGSIPKRIAMSLLRGPNVMSCFEQSKFSSEDQSSISAKLGKCIERSIEDSKQNINKLHGTLNNSIGQLQGIAGVAIPAAVYFAVILQMITNMRIAANEVMRFQEIRKANVMLDKINQAQSYKEANALVATNQLDNFNLGVAKTTESTKFALESQMRLQEIVNNHDQYEEKLRKMFAINRSKSLLQKKIHEMDDSSPEKQVKIDLYNEISKASHDIDKTVALIETDAQLKREYTKTLSRDNILTALASQEAKKSIQKDVFDKKITDIEVANKAIEGLVKANTNKTKINAILDEFPNAKQVYEKFLKEPSLLPIEIYKRLPIDEQRLAVDKIKTVFYKSKDRPEEGIILSLNTKAVPQKLLNDLNADDFMNRTPEEVKKSLFRAGIDIDDLALAVNTKTAQLGDRLMFASQSMKAVMEKGQVVSGAAQRSHTKDMEL